jgi:hypothetical protein
VNTQDTNPENQKTDDQLANFLFLHQAYKQFKPESYTMKEELLCLGNNALYLKNSALTPTSLVSQMKPGPPSFHLVLASFTYTKPGPGCQGHVTLFLIFHKQIPLG